MQIELILFASFFSSLVAMRVRRVIPDDENAWFNDPTFYEPSDSDESDVRDVTPFVVRFKGSMPTRRGRAYNRRLRVHLPRLSHLAWSTKGARRVRLRMEVVARLVSYLEFYLSLSFICYRRRC